MTVANEVHASSIAAAPTAAAERKPPFWQQRPFYR